MSEQVIHPTHYNQGGIEAIDAIEAAIINKPGIEAGLVFNVIKYLWRYEAKNGLQDVDKALFYLNRLRNHLAKKQSDQPLALQDPK